MRAVTVLLVALTAAVFGGGCSNVGALGGKDTVDFLDPGEMAGLRAPMAQASSSLATDARPPAAAPAIPAAAREQAAAATRPGEARQVIYIAGFRVVVADVPGSIQQIREMADELGGYLQEVAGSAITVRIPAKKFDEAVEFVEQVGEVVDRQVKAQDVTEELRDLRTHLDNQEKLRQRFQELLGKAQKVEDALKIEAELARVTEELDRTKGKLRALELQIAMSTIRVEFNAAVPQNPRGTGPRLPFDWVADLGDGLVEGQVRPNVRTAGIFGHGPRFKPPAGFVRYFEDDDETEAMNADGLRLKVIRGRNVDKAPLAFWSTLVRKSLVEGRSLKVHDEETGKAFYLIRGTRQVGGRLVGYVLTLKRNDGHVAVFEAWGPKEHVDEQFETLRQSGLSVDPG
jgi:hypothetical protein